MARIKSEKQYNSFVKGLITEASALTYPENASLDEDNFVLKRNGTRERRLGIDYESGYSLVATGIGATALEQTRMSYHTWINPGGDSTVSIGIVRVNNKLWFFDTLQTTISASLLNGGAALTISGLANAEIETAPINNFLVIVSKDLEKPVVLAYDKDTELVSQTNVPIQVRDTWGIVDGLQTNERPTTLSKSHEYNLLNQGWNRKIRTTCSTGDDTQTSTGGLLNYWKLSSSSALLPTYTANAAATSVDIPAIACTFTEVSIYPSNADMWSLGKVGDASSADFAKYKPQTMVKESIDNTEAARGSIIIDAFYRGLSRRTVLGNTTIPQDWEQGKLTTIAAYAGRVFFAGVESDIYDGDARSPNYSNCIFYSQVVDTADKIGRCYSEADPTSPNISDRIDTDGGFIQIPDATKIIKLLATKSSLLVFAENGVFEVFGESGFTAVSHQVSKLTNNGCSSPKSVVEAYGAVVAWSKAGIFAYTQDNVTSRYKAESISLTTIQTFYNDLSDITKNNARGFYDEKENTIRWLYNDLDSYSETSFVNKYNRELVFDLTLQSFYPQSIDTTLGPYVADYADIPSYASSVFQEAVFSGTDEVLVTSLDAVVISANSLVARASQFNFLTFVGTSFTFSKYHNLDFLDWFTYDSTGINYSSYLLTGYEIFGEILRHKQVPYIWFYFERTEDGFTDVGGNLEIDNPSSCLVRAKWNWTDSANSGQWGSQFQAYRFNRNYIPSGAADTFDYGYSVITTKSRLRGSGRAVSLLIESEEGKDMKLLGWAVIITGDSSPDGN